MTAELPLFEESDSDTRVQRDFLDIPGLTYRPNFITRGEQEQLLDEIDHLPWRDDISRRVQHYGFKYDYKSRRIDESLRVGPLPEFACSLGRRLVDEGLITEEPDQVIVNEYLPGQGITLHIDCEPCFKDYIVTVSLGSVYLMEFKDTLSEDVKELALELGSALVLSGDARYRWKHGIKPRRSDRGRLRGRRVSLTFRKVILAEPAVKQRSLPQDDRNRTANCGVRQRNDGKQLEKLVSLVESIDLPKGFKVETNTPVYEDGKQIAELDILISGVIGTVEYKTLFECRDRPSAGRQGVGWIEQLVGRRERLHVNAIVAVSTTGFAPAARNFANERNVPLRNVEELTTEEIQGWLPLRAPVVYREARFTSVKFVVIPEDQTIEQIESAGREHERIQITNETKILRNLNTQEQLSLLDLWKKLVKERETEIFEGINNVNDSIERVIRVSDDVLRAHLVELPDRRGKIHELVYTATVWMYPSQVPLAYCVSYDARHVVAHWEGDNQGEDNFTVILTKEAP